MRTDSSLFEQFTLGIEEEFQIVDPNTGELRSHVSEILEEGRMLLGEQVKPEMIQSMIEVGTGRFVNSFGNYWSLLTMLLTTCARAKRSGTSTRSLSEVLRPTTSFESGVRQATSKLS